MLGKLIQKESKSAGGWTVPGSIAGYELVQEEPLGVGGMGAVYKVRRQQGGEELAIKVMVADGIIDQETQRRFRQIFQREVMVISSLDNPNIIKFYEHESIGSFFYFVMEYCSGGSVADLMKRCGGRLSLKEAGSIILQALNGLSAMHERKFVHRDLKPENILLTADGVAKVSDFSLAKNFEEAGLSRITATNTPANGAYPFMSREHIPFYKYLEPVSDVWSMGAIFYNMLTGEYPRDFSYNPDPAQVVLHAPLLSLRDRDTGIPSEFAEVIDRALADEVDARYQTAAEFHKALSKALARI